MSLFGQSGSNASSPTALSGYRVQTSIFGAGIPIVLGTARVAGNVLWLGDWTASAVQAGGKGGGKGAGGGKGGGQFNYSASFIIALAQGPIQGILRAWQDKSQITPNWFFASGARGQSVWSFLSTNHPGEAIGYSEIAYLGWEHLNIGTGGTLSNYSFEIQGQNCDAPGGVDSVAATAVYFLLTNFNCANFPISSIQNQWFPVPYDSGHTYVIGDRVYYAGLPYTSLINGNIANQPDISPLDWNPGVSGSDFYTYCLANSLLVSPVIDNQSTFQSFLQEFLLIANSEAFTSEGLIKFATYGDKATTGNGGSFTPNLTPVYALDNDAFIVKGAEKPIVFTIEAGQDANNKISVEWTNRAREYNLEPMTDEDDDAVSKYGLNIGSLITIHSACNATTAQNVLTTQLKRSVYMLRKAKFTLGWAYSLLEPMDIVTVPEQYPSTGTVGVRILSIQEDEQGNFAVEGEVLPFPILSPASNPKQVSGGFTPGYEGNPGIINAPIFVEEPPEMLVQNLVSQLTLLICLSWGAQAGGCGVYVSKDGGNSYDYVGQQTSPTNMGFLTADYPFSSTDPDITNLLSCNLQPSIGQTATVLQDVADAFKNLLIVDQEIMSNEYARLTASNTYDLQNGISGVGLRYVRRGVFSTNETNHKAGAPIAFIGDGNQFELPYQPTDIGSTWYFKFPAFNKSGQQVQDVSAATAYPFTLQAPYVRGPMPWAGTDISTVQDPANGNNLDVIGQPIINVFSDVIPSPTIASTANVIGGVGAFPQNLIAALCAIDANGKYTPISNLTEFTIGGSSTSVNFAVTMPPDSYGYELFVGYDFDHPLYGQGAQFGWDWSGGITYSTGDLVVYNHQLYVSAANSNIGHIPAGSPAYWTLFVSWDSAVSPNSLPTPSGTYGAPDGRATNWHIQAKTIIHGGIFDTNLIAVNAFANTITINPPTPLTAHSLIGRIVSLIGPVDTLTPPYEIQILDNDTAGLLTLPASTLFPWNIGDLVLIRTKATTFSATTIGDAEFVGPFAPTGLDVNAETSNLVRIISDPAGTIVDGVRGAEGQVSKITSNDHTTLTFETMPVAPSVGASFIVEETPWHVDVHTTSTPTSVPPVAFLWASFVTYGIGDIRSYFGTSNLTYISLQASNTGNQPDISPAYWDVYSTPQIASIPIQDLQQYFALIRVIPEDTAGNDAPEIPAELIQRFIYPQAIPSNPGYYPTIPIVAGVATVDPANGQWQVLYIPNDGTIVNIQAGGAPLAGAFCTVYVRTPVGLTWNSGTTYAAAQIAIGSDGFAYSSLAGGNLNHDPVTDITHAYWGTGNDYATPSFSTGPDQFAGDIATRYLVSPTPNVQDELDFTWHGAGTRVTMAAPDVGQKYSS